MRTVIIQQKPNPSIHKGCAAYEPRLAKGQNAEFHVVTGHQDTTYMGALEMLEIYVAQQVTQICKELRFLYGRGEPITLKGSLGLFRKGVPGAAAKCRSNIVYTASFQSDKAMDIQGARVNEVTQ